MLQQLSRNLHLLELNYYEIKIIIENSSVTTENSSVDIFQGYVLPLNDMESFNNFDIFLGQEENMKKSVSYHNYII